MEAEDTITETSWWSRPCGGWEVLRQVVPLVISSGSISLMNFTDRMFLLWYDTDAMTASLQSGMLFWSTISLPAAVAVFTTTFVAQYHGSGNLKRIGPVVWQGIWLGLFVAPLFFVLAPWLTALFVWFDHAEHLIALERQYFHIMLWGCAAAIGGEAAAGFFRGRGKMHIEMYVNLFCVFVNIALDYAMIFGRFGFPAWGLAGAAIATVISQWCRFGLYLFLMFLTDMEDGRFHILSGMRPDFSLVRRLLYNGLASGSYVFCDTVTFTLFIMIVGGLGAEAAGATTIAFTMNSFTFMPMVGIGIVVTSMVGNRLGNNQPALARRATQTALVLGGFYTGLFGIAFLALPELLLSGFAAFSDPDEFTAIFDTTVILLRFIALYLFFDSCSVIASSALRGAGDTVYIMRVVLVLAPALPTACFIGIHFYGLGLIWCWVVLTVDVLLYCICFMLRFQSKHWESKRVIETPVVKEG